VIDPVVVRLSVAALSGLAVGLERERSGHATGPHRRFAGIRTFLLLGGTAGVAGWLVAAGSGALGVTLIAGELTLVVAAYLAAARPGGVAVEATTEVAAILVIALGTAAGLGYLEIAGGATAVMVLALSEKERVRAAAARIGEHEMRATAQFAVLALVVLPLLPDATYGPFGGVQLRALWMVVLLFSGLNFAGYLARKAVGEERGYGVTGMLGGLISSTAVAFQFSRASHDAEQSPEGLAVGVVGACTVLLPRVLVLSGVLSYRVALALLPFFLAPLIAGAAMVAYAFLRQWEPTKRDAPEHHASSPLRLWSAIRMAVAFQVSLMVLSAVRQQLGTAGVLASAAVLGLTDMDALTLSMNRLGSSPDLVPLAARAIVIGVIANSVLKLVLTQVLGTSPFKRLAGAGLAIQLAVAAVSLAVFW
jgi:uncharacterized membrane protein (DUF4010 family)